MRIVLSCSQGMVEGEIEGGVIVSFLYRRYRNEFPYDKGK